MSILQAAIWYSYALKRQPLLIKCTTASILIGIGDQIAQNVFERRSNKCKPINFGRTAQMMVYGAFISAPSMHYWYKFLDKYIKGSHVIPTMITATQHPMTPQWRQFLSKDYKFVLYRVVLDQSFFAPYIIAVFFTTMTIGNTLQHQYVNARYNSFSLQECVGNVKKKLRERFVPTYINGAKFWPLATAINFAFISPMYRVLFSNLVSLGWNTYLSVIQYQQKSDELVSSPTQE